MDLSKYIYQWKEAKGIEPNASTNLCHVSEKQRNKETAF